MWAMMSGCIPSLPPQSQLPKRWKAEGALLRVASFMPHGSGKK